MRVFSRDRPDVNFDLTTISLSDLQVARNILAHRFLAANVYTHVLFIDVDTGFSPNLIARLIDFDRPFVGAVCPARQLNFAAFSQASVIEADLEQALSLSQNYICAEALIPECNKDQSPRKFRLHSGGFVKMSKLGTGILLVQRRVFEAISDKFPDIHLDGSRTYRRMGIPGSVGQYFAPYREDSGEWLAEDLSFCKRWTDTGGEVWGCISEKIQHVGRFVHKGAYIDRMRHGIIQNEEM